MGYNAALIHKKIFIYELATYFYKNEHGTFTKNHLRIGDVVMMQIQDYNESYAIVEAIFSHQGNDNKLYVFIIVKWFEETNRTRLGCPVYRIQTDNRWRHVFPLSAIDLVNNAHFLHDCSNSCTSSHDLLNTNYYIRNLYYFKAI
jgi:hypothetical protein